MNRRTLIISLLGVALGATGGWLYYYYVGCHSGTCAITSRPLNSTLYGGLMGGLLFNTFSDKKTLKKAEGNKP